MRSGALILVLALAACRGARTPAQPLPERTPYLALFERGKTFTLPARQTTATHPVPAHGTARCTVEDVKQVGDANVSRLRCAAPYAGLLISGTWVATPAGLYHPYLPIDDPDELALLGDDDLLIATVPSERDHSHVLDHAQESIEAFGYRGSWCVQHTTAAAGERRRFVLCFDGATITGGSDFVGSADEWQQVELGVSPPHDDGGGDDD